MKKRYKVLLWILSVFTLLLVTLAILITQTKFLEKQINLFLRSAVEKDYPVRITIADISGNVITGLKLSGVRIEYTEPGFEYQLMEIDSIQVKYSLSDLWNKRWILHQAVLSNPRFELHQSKDGRWLLPKFKKAGGLRKTGLFDFQINQISLQEGAINLVTAHETVSIDSLELQGKLIKDRNGWKVSLPQGSLFYQQDSLRISRLSTALTVKEKKLQIDTLSLISNWGNLELGGKLELGKKPEFDVVVDAQQVRLDDFSKIPPNIKLEGKVDLKGNLNGNIENFTGETTVDGIFFERDLQNVAVNWSYKNKEINFKKINGRIFKAPLVGSAKLDLKTDPPRYELKCQVRKLDLANIIKDELHSDFTGLVDLSGQGFNDREMQMSLDVQLTKGAIDIYDFDMAQGKMDIDFKRIYFHPGFTAKYKHTTGDFSGNLEYSGNIDITGEVQFDDLTDFWGKTFVKEISGRGRATVKVGGLTQDFDIAGEFQSDSLWVYQLYSSMAEGKFDLKTFVKHQKGWVALDFRKGEAWKIPYDSLMGHLTVDSLFVRIDTAYGGNPYASLHTKGNLDASGEIQPLRLFDGSIIYQGIPFTTGADTIQVDISNVGYALRQARLYNGQGDFLVTGSIGYEEEMDLNLKFDHLDIHPWMKLYLPGREIYGEFSGTSELKGNFSDPVIRLDGEVDSLTYFEVYLGKFTGSVACADSQLNLDSLTLSSPDWHYVASGFIPINLSFTDTSAQRLLNSPQQIKFSGQGNRFSVVHLFLPDIEYLKGDFRSQIDISGTPAKPQLNGSIHLEKGELKFDQLKDPLMNLAMNIRMENDRIYFEKVSAQLEGRALKGEGNLFSALFKKGPKPGSLKLNGMMEVESFNSFIYDLTLTGRNFPIVYEYMDLSGIADFDLKIQGKTPPKVFGEITLKQLNYEEPFGSPVTLALAGQKAADPSALWDWELAVEVPNNAWIRNSDMNAEFSGTVDLYRIDGQIIPLGILEAFPGGKFYVASKSFDIERGRIIFENVEGLDPTLDFVISSRIYEAPEATGYTTSSGDQVQLTVTGTISQPVLGTPEGSKYTQQEVLEMMVLQSPGGSENGKSSPFQEKVLTSLGADVGSQLVQKFAYGLGVETFYLRPRRGSSGLDFSESELTVGGYLTRGLYWQYTSKFSPNPDLSLQYRLNRNLFLEGIRDRNNLYHLGLNLRWEF